MKYECEVIRDLLPIYKDGVSHKKSNEIIEEHLKECSACKEYYDAIRQTEVKFPEIPVLENPAIIDYGKRIKQKRRKVFIGVVSVITFLLLSLISMTVLLVTGGPPVKTSDVKDYGVFEDFKGYSNLYIFPVKLPDSAQIESYYYYQLNRIFDPTCQIYLEYSLSKSDFDAEIARLARISEKYEHNNYKDIVNNIVYDTEHFKYPAYVTIFNNNHCYEYALFNEKEKKIICVFTQFSKEKDIKFNKEYLPVDFGDNNTIKGFNIYYSDQSLGYFERHLR